MWPLATIVAVLAVLAVGPRLGLTKTAPAPLWTNRPVGAEPTTATPAPNWVGLAQTLKPAVVNISTNRVESVPPLLESVQ